LVEKEPPLMNVPTFRALYLIVVSPPPTLKEPEKFSSEFNDFLDCCLRHTPSERWSAEALLKVFMFYFVW
jgi:serine/threonine protein kinase